MKNEPLKPSRTFPEACHLKPQGKTKEIVDFIHKAFLVKGTTTVKKIGHKIQAGNLWSTMTLEINDYRRGKFRVIIEVPYEF